MNDANKVPPAVIALIVIVLIGLATFGVSMLNKPADTTQPTTQESAPTSQTPSEESAVATDYTDGSYTATGNYSTPGGQESVELTVTLQDGKVVDSTFSGDPHTAQAEEYQGQFTAGYKQSVVGKNVDDIKLTRVAGSSLTSNGFNDALEQIKTDARA